MNPFSSDPARVGPRRGLLRIPFRMSRDLTPYQRGIVNRYYEHKGTIHATKLNEIVSDITVSDGGPKLDRLWKAAADYLTKCGVDGATVAAVTARRDLKALGEIAGAIMTGRPAPTIRK
jgi:hypothetical protein